MVGFDPFLFEFVLVLLRNVQGAKEFAQRPGFQDQFSVDRVRWETMKKAGKNQHEIWGNKMYKIVYESQERKKMQLN